MNIYDPIIAKMSSVPPSHPISEKIKEMARRWLGELERVGRGGQEDGGDGEGEDGMVGDAGRGGDGRGRKWRRMGRDGVGNG